MSRNIKYFKVYVTTYRQLVTNGSAGIEWIGVILRQAEFGRNNVLILCNIDEIVRKGQNVTASVVAT